LEVLAVKRRLALLLSVGLAVSGLSACGSKSTDTTATPEATTAESAATETTATDSTATETTPAETVVSETGAPVTEPTASSVAPTVAVAADLSALKGKKIVYLINGALGDKGFYDSGQAGMDALKTAGAVTRTLEANFDAAKYQSLVDGAFENADIVFAIAYGFEDPLKAAAKAHPDTPVINLDFDIKDADGNITSVDFVEEQSAFLAGAAAALATTDASIKGTNPDKTIGVVGGDSDPVTTSFMFAYENGAKSIDPAIKVERKTLGGAWDDQAKGKQAAEQLYDSGSDVVFQVAAAAGLGVLQAAKDRNLFAIGVDANQNDLQPGHIIASDVKNVGGTIEKVAGTIAAGSYQKGQVLTFGIKEGGVDLDLAATTQVLPAATQEKLLALRQQIVDGSLAVELYKP
jgi:basic membrane protein A and related proteins